MSATARTRERRPAVFAALAAAVFFLAPGPPAAAARQGLIVGVVKIDGSRIQGELLAVRRESIVVQDDSGYVSFLRVADLKFIEKPKRSAFVGAVSGAIQYGFIGAIVGNLTAGLSKAKNETLNPGAYYGGGAGLLLGGLWGGIRGAPTKAIETIEFEGYPRDIVEASLVKLSREARIRDWS